MVLDIQRGKNNNNNNGITLQQNTSRNIKKTEKMLKIKILINGFLWI
jgi:hypothetical protein